MTTAAASTTTITFLSLSTPRQLSVSQRGSNGQTLSFPKPSFVKQYSSFSLSSSNSSSVIEEEENNSSPQLDDLPLQSEATITRDPDALPTVGGCKACGREEMEKGCNGEGRIQGGIATVPGFGWWPIKAYRPCPGFVASGGRYRRRGQSMDEVAFGRGKKGVPVEISDKPQSSKKKQGTTKLKR